LIFKNSTLTPTDQKNLQTAWNTMQGWTDHSVKGIDNLRQALGNLMDEFKVAGGNPRSSVVLSNTINTLKQSLSDNVPGYSRVLQTYGNKSNVAQTLVRELSLGGNAKTSTQLRQVMNLFEKNPSVTDTLRSIMGNKDTEDFLNEVSGAMLSKWLPANKIGTYARGLGEIGAGGAAVLSGAIGGIPAVGAAAGGLAAMSPRVMGGVARVGGAVASKIPTVRRAVTGAVIGGTQ
jgi:hypothetical protein